MATAAEGEVNAAGGAKTESRVHDKYCWICHEICAKHNCSTCSRSFHDKCLRLADKKQCLKYDVLTCPVCLTLKQSEELFVGKQSVLDNLKHVKDEILNHDPFKVLSHLPDWTESQYTPKIANPINLNIVFHKIDNRQYNSLDAFLADIDCIFHNCKLHLQYGKRDQITKTVEELIHFCKFECQCISACINCYENYYVHAETEWNTMACQVPHLILWTKLDRSCEFWPAKMGFTHWPSKLLAVNDGIVTVIFFGDSKFDDVRAQDCYLYSSTAPSAASRSIGNQEDMKPALKEVELYIKNIEKKFGRVDKSSADTLFDPRRINAHMKAMFPEYTGQTSAYKKEGVNNDAKNVENIATDNGEVPAKRPRLNRQERVTRKNLDFTPVSYYPPENDAVPDHDTFDEISETMVKLHDQIENLNSLKKQKIDDLKADFERIKKSNAEYQTKNAELQKQLNVTTLKQTEEFAQLKNHHSKEVAAIKAAHNKEIAEVNKVYEQNASYLKVQLHAKEAENAKIQEQNAKQELELKITTNFLEKAKRKVDELKACTGCEKPLNGLCQACDTIWADLSIAKIEPLDES